MMCPHGRHIWSMCSRCNPFALPADFGQAVVAPPDPRDARIAELEAALSAAYAALREYGPKCNARVRDRSHDRPAPNFTTDGPIAPYDLGMRAKSCGASATRDKITIGHLCDEHCWMSPNVVTAHAPAIRAAERAGR